MIGIVIASKNNWPYTIRTIQTALAHTPDSFILIIDDASEEWQPDYFDRLLSIDPKRIEINRFEKPGGLTRSWNYGVSRCRQLGMKYCVVANNDLAFSSDWFSPVRWVLDGPEIPYSDFRFAGPVSNAPGHSKAQDVRTMLPDYEVADSDEAIAETSNRLFGRKDAVETNRLNGFCFAAKTSSFERNAIDAKRGIYFDHAIPLAGNEDAFFRRAVAAGATLLIAADSFVFHYRGVTRQGKGGLERGRASNDSLPGMESLSAIQLVAKPRSPLRPECIHFGRLINPVPGRPSCRQPHFCNLLEREVLRCVECQICHRHDPA